MSKKEHHNHHHTGSVHLDEADWEAWAADTELQGEVLLAFVTETAARVSELRGPDAAPVRRVIDIGSGPGVGTCELARIFPEAQVTAVDGSSAMLDRTARRADARGLESRVRTHLAELPAGLDGFEPADLIWASMSLHHIGDEVGALRILRDLLEPDGLIAIAEMGEPMRVLPNDLGLGHPGLGDRLADTGTGWFADMREGLADSVPSAELASMLASAGFEVLDSQLAHQRLDPPLADDARRVVLAHLRRSRQQSSEHLDKDDLLTLDVLCDVDDPRSVLHRHDVFVAASRQILIARPARSR